MMRRSPGGIAYRVWSYPGRPWVAITHGAFCGSAEFEPLAEALSPKWSVLTWDLPGHGASADVRLATRLDGAARAFTEVLNSAGIEKAVLLGHSYGGALMQHVARATPARCTAVLAYAAVPLHRIKLPSPDLAMVALESMWAVSGWRAFARSFAGQCSDDPSIRSDMASRLERTPSPRLRSAIYSGLAHAFGPAPMSPTALLYGEREGFAGALPAMRSWRHELPATLAIEAPDCGHMIHIEKPEAFVAWITQLLDRLSDAPADAA